MFFLGLVFNISNYTEINNYAIKLVNSQQLSYKSIYSLKLVELEILKAYIKTNLANNFTKLFKLSTNTSILIDQKSNKFFQLYVNYQFFSNLIIKNWYILLLVEKSLGQLVWAKQFTQLDFISIYHQIKICKRNK